MTFWCVGLFKPTSLHHVRRFDGNAALLLVFARVCEAGLSGAGRSNDPRFGHQRVSQRGLPMIHVGNHGHVPDVGLLVHDGPDLIHSEVHLCGGWWWWWLLYYTHPVFHNQHRFSLFIICIYLFMTTTRCHFKWSYKKKDMLETESIRLTARTECEDLTVWFLNKQTGSGFTESPLMLQLSGPFQNHRGTKSLHFTPQIPF